MTFPLYGPPKHSRWVFSPTPRALPHSRHQDPLAPDPPGLPTPAYFLFTMVFVFWGFLPTDLPSLGVTAGVPSGSQDKTNLKQPFPRMLRMDEAFTSDHSESSLSLSSASSTSSLSCVLLSHYNFLLMMLVSNTPIYRWE